MVEQHIEIGRGGHRGRHPAADRDVDQFGVIDVEPDDPHEDPRRSSRSRPTPRACPTPPTRSSPSMGNYVFDADVLIDAVHADATLEGSQARHGRRHRAGPRRAGRRVRLRLQEQRRSPAAPSATGATGATSGRWTPTSTRTWTSSRSTRSSTSTTTTGRSTPSYGPYPPAKFVHGHHGPVRRGAQLGRLPRCRHLRRAGQRLGRLPRRARAQLHRDRRQRAPRRRRRSGGTAASSGRSSTRTSPSPRRPDRVRPRERPRPAGFPVTESGITVVGKGQVVVP